MNTESQSTAPRDKTRFEMFDLTVHLGPANVPWISASSRIGLLHGIPRADPNIPKLEDLLDLVHDYRDSVHFAENIGAAEISKALGQMIFGEPQVLELFQATRGAAADRGRQTLIRVLASPHLATLPWELLPDPAARNTRDRAGFLALAPDAHVVRMARGRTYATRTEPLEPPLNLLIVLSSPSPVRVTDDTLAFDIYEVKRSLLGELDPLIKDGLLKVDIEDRPTLENLRRRVGGVSRGYQLFHYVGHALPDHLVLEDAAGRREDQPSERVCEILRLCPELRLAVFAGCETARARAEPADLDARLASGSRDLISLADRCVQDACPIVIGMQAVLPFRTERLFTRFFYQGIASGYSVVEALQLARGAARSDSRVAMDLLDWSVPALFIGGGEPGPLIDRNAKGVPPPPSRRKELKIGLRQSETRFFARDLPLRQAVDLLAARTRERVLVITGTVGVGKTYLVDRALEELGDDASHVLYVKMGRLAPQLDVTLQQLRMGEERWGDSLAEFTEDQPLRALCTLVSELISDHSLSPRQAPTLAPSDWWERVIEEIIQARVVVVLDDFDLFDELIEACFARWLDPIVGQVLTADDKRTEVSETALLEALLGIVRDTPQGSFRAPAGRGASRAFQAIDKQLTGGDWSLNGWLSAAASRALEPLLLERLESDPLARPGPSQRPRGHYEPQPPAQIREIAQKIDATRSVIERALKQIAERRSGSRTAIVTTLARTDFLGLAAPERFEMRLGHLSWQETWRWIRRNLPGLTRYDEAQLIKLWAQLGPELERWEDLEREILSLRGKEASLEQIVKEISQGARRKTGAIQTTATRRRGQRPLRLAIAGPHVRSPQALAEAITRLANQHGVGGRVSFDARGTAATLGEIIDHPSPFSDSSGIATSEEIMKWLRAVLARQPDIVLLDYGEEFAAAEYKLRTTPERELLSRTRHRCLFVAAGDNSGPDRLVEPGIFPEALTVGAVDHDGLIQPYSVWRPTFGKPDLFMADELDRSPLADALNLEGADRIEGTSFSALHAAATAAIVWSLVPDLRPIGLRQLLVKGARPLEPSTTENGVVPVGLRVTHALEAARMKLIEDTLRAGPCSRETLAAITGQDAAFLQETLDAMRDTGSINRVAGGRLERFELAR